MKPKDPKKIQKLLQKLINSESHSFPPHRQPLNAPTENGVYIIYNSQDQVVHVGRSVSGQEGLHQRLTDHLHTNSSFTINYPELEGDGSKLRDGYKFKYLVIHDDKKRALVEALATGSLCPLHLGLGKTKQ